MTKMSRTILVTKDNGTEFKATVPNNSSLTFGPFSPPTKGANNYDRSSLAGTLRIYAGATAKATKILAVFIGVVGFRDIDVVDYSEKVAVEEGATVWKSDADGYQRVEKVQRANYFEDELPPKLSDVVGQVMNAAEEF